MLGPAAQHRGLGGDTSRAPGCSNALRCLLSCGVTSFLCSKDELLKSVLISAFGPLQAQGWVS